MSDYREECLGCHMPVPDTDRVYIEGYPLLRDRPVGGAGRLLRARGSDPPSSRASGLTGALRRERP